MPVLLLWLVAAERIQKHLKAKVTCATDFLQWLVTAKRLQKCLKAKVTCTTDFLMMLVWVRNSWCSTARFNLPLA